MRVLERLKDIIAEIKGISRDTITTNTDLRGDLEFGTLYGRRLIKALNREYEIDWTGFRFCLHFGVLSRRLPTLCRLRDSDLLYESQPIKVSHLVETVQTGRWRGTPLVLHSRLMDRVLLVGDVLDKVCNWICAPFHAAAILLRLGL